MTQLNEVWAQGSVPGDAPISSVTVPVDPVFVARQAARERMRAFAQSARPSGGPPSTLPQQIHDLAVAMGLAG